MLLSICLKVKKIVLQQIIFCLQQKTSEASKLRRDLAALESQMTAASTSSTASSATCQQKQPDSEFFLDVLVSLPAQFVLR